MHPRWSMLALICLGTGALALPSYGLPTVFAFLQEEFALSRAELGLFLSALESGTVVSFILGGWAADAFGTRRILPAAQVLMGLGLLGLTFAGGYEQNLAILVLIGVAFGMGNPALSIAVLFWFPAQTRATAMGIKQAGAPLTGIVTAAILPTIALSFGWRTGIQLLALTSVVVALAVLVLYRDPASAPRVRRPGLPSLRQIAALARQRDLLLLNVFSAVLFAYQFIVVGYLILYLHDQLEIPIVAGGLILALAQAGSLVGRIAWGALSDTLLRGRRVPALGLVGGLSTGLAIAIALLPPGVPLWILTPLAFGVGFCAMGWQALRYALLTELTPAGIAGTALGVSQTIAESGLIIGPPAFGALADLAGYRWAWVVVGALTGAATVAVVRGIKEGDRIIEHPPAATPFARPSQRLWSRRD